MREYSVAGQIHRVYDDPFEVPTSIKFSSTWKKSEIGDWVTADDGCIIQILRKGQMLNKGKYPQVYVGTCTGTYTCTEKSTMDTKRRKNIYSFGGGKTQYESVKERKNITGQETIFAKYIARGYTPKEAYKKAFCTGNDNYAKIRAGVLLKTERVVK